MVLGSLEQSQEFSVARTVNGRRSQDDVLGVAVVSDFEFAGECGMTSEYFGVLQDLCRSFVYAARPVDRGASGKRTYALLSSDLRVHYRSDLATPTESDPTVDNTSPSTAADLPGGAPGQPGKEAESGMLASLLRTLRGLVDTALGPGGQKQATVELHESNAVKDLREFSAAEVAFNAMMGQGRYYLSPEQLADATTFKPFGLQPFLPAYFVQPARQGYRFEFIGEQPETPPGALARLGRVHQSFIYVARPVDPGPAGRRTFALYPDGQIFARTDARVPTRNDTPLGAR